MSPVMGSRPVRPLLSCGTSGISVTTTLQRGPGLWAHVGGGRKTSRSRTTAIRERQLTSMVVRIKRSLAGLLQGQSSLDFHGTALT